MDAEPTFTERDMLVLAAVCDTLIPALHLDSDPHGLYARQASALNVPALIAAILGAVASPEERAQLKLALSLLDQPLVNALWGQNMQSIRHMALSERTALLRDWMASRLGPRRRAITALKRLALFVFYAFHDPEAGNPNWPGIGYPGPPGAATDAAKPIRPLAFFEDSTLETDVVIVGSGAGGGVVAGELSAAGLDVIVLEKGGYYAEPDFDGSESRSLGRMYEKRGFMVTSDLGLVLLAGSTLGGGTTINWAGALRTPDYVLREWADEYGLTAFTGKIYQEALDQIAGRIHVTEDESGANARNAVLVRGSEALGYPVKVMPRNVQGCEDCGFCGFGCKYGAKQGTLATYLQDAYQRGARIAVNTVVERVLIANGRAVGVVARVEAPGSRPVRLTVRARAVVAAAGAVHTPALLMRSGLTNAHIGRNLHLHPSTGAFGFYDEPIRGWEGVMMSHYLPKFSNMDGYGYGFTLESAPGHPGLTAVALPWLDGYHHKRLMAQYPHLANLLIVTRDRDSGRVTLDARGEPVLRYALSSFDRAHLVRGVVEALRIHHAAGARQLCGPTPAPGLFIAGEGADFEAYLRAVEAALLRKHEGAVGSVHQMSSCRMGSNPARGAISPEGETFEVRDLFVADASALPTSTGVNPMLTIMAVSHLIAQHIKARLIS